MTATMAWTPPLAEVHELLAGAPTLTILGQLRDGVMMVDGFGRIMYANPAMHDALGSHRDELSGRTAFELGLEFLSDSSMVLSYSTPSIVHCGAKRSRSMSAGRLLARRLNACGGQRCPCLTPTSKSAAPWPLRAA